jgi:hypothetical protein
MFTSQSWLDLGNRDLRRPDVQKLGGLVLYWTIVVYPLRLVLAAIFAMVGGPEKEFVSPVGNARERELRWREFDEATEFVRLIVQQRDNWEMTFTSPMAFALSPKEILRMPGGWDHLWIGGDASGSEARMGDVVAATDYDAQTWHAEHMNLYTGALGRVCGMDGHENEGMTAEELIIFVKELAALAALVVQHGPRWTNKIACAAWDNQNVVRAMETRRSRNRYVRYLLAIITRCEIEHKFMPLVFYINTHHNHPADDISREFGKWLPLGYDAAVAKMQEYLTQHFPQYAHFRHEPMQELLEHLTAENHALRSFALPAEAADPNSLAYQLGQARLAPSPWSGAAKTTQQRPRVGAGVAAVVELRAGLGQLAAAMESLGARVHGLMEPDPVAQRVLQRRFPGAQRSGRVWNASEWRSVAESHPIVLGTIVSAATTREIAAGLAELARLAAPSAVLVAAIGSGEWEVPESILAEAAGLCGCRLRSRAKLIAAEWGALHS